MNENFEKSLDRLLIHLSGHCRNHRLIDLGVERLSKNQRDDAIIATLDFFEQEVQGLIAKNNRLPISPSGEDAGDRRLRPRDLAD
jgi:hypothetical protein